MRRCFLRRNRRLASSTNPWTYYCLFGLLATTDTRISEALNLQTKDVDWSEGVLTIHGKCGKSRLVPLHCSTLKVLSAYSARRDRLSGKESVFHFFVSRRGTRLDADMFVELFTTYHVGSDCVRSLPPIAHLFTTFATMPNPGICRIECSQN
jgi:site-specific recombinase XerD